MGVPKFYRWLSERYPLINQLISDETLLPEFDNLYLDMNGILHNCSHPNDNVASQLSDRDIMLGIFSYIDRIVTQIVRPQKVLLLAVDGCAPRAKLNQQRSRRFRSAKDAKELRDQMRERGEDVDEQSIFDSNCITPGTEWMAKVSEHLKYFIKKKIKDDPLWQKLTIIYSGMDVPGEGEHKIMQYIRHQRAKGCFEPNTRHCMYGQDADLVMLGLITHEPHFTLLREVIDFNSFRNRGGPKMRQSQKAKFQLLHLSILREYLQLEFTLEMPKTREYDSEHLIDDFVFLTFLVGNDFLPHMPSLDIGEHAFDKLFGIYRTMLAKWGSGYLTDNGKVSDPDRLEELLFAIGEMEDEIFTEREADLASFNRRRRAQDQKFGGASSVPTEDEEAEEARRIIAEVTEKLALAMGSEYMEKHDLAFKTKYYMEKLEISPKDEMVHDRIRQSYVEGLIWCLAYYYEGCISWGWFYPFHYGPFISDLTDMRLRFARATFSMGQPFTPFFQLLGCLPPASAKFLPRPYHRLMTDSASPIIDFYPPDFKVDANGKKNPWEAVNLLPFIDEKRMKEAVEQCCPDNLLTPEERKRNLPGQIIIFYYNPENKSTVRSCNPDIGLPDIVHCHSAAYDLPPNAFENLEGAVCSSALRPGVTIPLAGYPSLNTLPRSKVEVKLVNVNCFGSGSRYQTLVIEIEPMTNIPSAANLSARMKDRNVFVNWPNLHEALIVGIQDSKLSVNYEEDKSTGVPYVTSIENDENQQLRFMDLADDERRRYLHGRELPGTGGLEIGEIVTQLVVRPLQGLYRDPKTGATSKVFGKQEAKIPFQLALWENPCPDSRFEERSQATIVERAPVGARVVFLEGPHKGFSGIVMGHNEEQQTVNVTAEWKDKEPLFGLSIMQSIPEERYVTAPELAKALGIRSDVLGKVLGSVRIEPGKIDVGLNLKWNGRFQLLGYSRCVLNRQLEWSKQDNVTVVGSNTPQEEFLDGVWEFSRKTGELLHEYKQKFPMLFHSLGRLTHALHYTAQQLLGDGHVAQLQALQTWLKGLPSANLPRAPLATIAMPLEAAKAVERAADVRVAAAYSKEKQYKTFTGVPPQAIAVCGTSQRTDVASIDSQSKNPPVLGLRVCNIDGSGVPFGLWGTVVALHPHSACVEVLFDEEFMGGVTLGGLCSNHRGKLVPWSSVIVVSVEPPPSFVSPSQYSAKVQNHNQTKQAPAQPSHSFVPPSQQAQKAQKQGTQISAQASAPPRPFQQGQAPPAQARQSNVQKQTPEQNLKQSHPPVPTAAQQPKQSDMKPRSGQNPIPPRQAPASQPGEGLPDKEEIQSLLGKWQHEMNVDTQDFPSHHPFKTNQGSWTQNPSEQMQSMHTQNPQQQHMQNQGQGRGRAQSQQKVPYSQKSQFNQDTTGNQSQQLLQPPWSNQSQVQGQPTLPKPAEGRGRGNYALTPSQVLRHR